MREPRPKQLFPEGGKRLYELLRMDYEPRLIWVECTDERMGCSEDTLRWERLFDPMLYFWPVEGQHVVARFVKKTTPELRERLLRALLRDDAYWITIVRGYEGPPSPPGQYQPTFQWDNFGEPERFFARYGPSSVDPVAIPRGGDRADIERTRARTAASGGVPNWIGQNAVGDGTPVSGT